MNNTTNKNQKITPTDASDADENEEILGFSPKYDIFPLVLAIAIVVCNTLVLRLIIGVKSLRTVANFILGSLAFSDLLSGVPGIPLYLACSAVQTTIICGITQVLTRFFSISIVLHLILVSIDRYVAVTRAMRYRSLVTKRKAIFLLFFVWTAASFVALIQLSWVGLDVDVNEESDAFTKKMSVIYDVVCIALFFILPLIAMAFCYWKIFTALKEQLRAIKKNIPASMPSYHSNKQERRAALTFIGMIAVYIFCWLPFFMLNLQHQLGNEFFTLPIPVEYALFYYPRFLNSALNPLLYVAFKHDFRQAVQKLRGKEQGKKRSSTLSLQNTIGRSFPAASSLRSVRTPSY